MEWTEDERKFIKTSAKRLGKPSPQYLSFLIKKHMNKVASADDVASLMREVLDSSPPAALTPLVVSKKEKDLRGICVDFINEAKKVLSEQGVYKAPPVKPSELTPVLCLSDLHFGEIIKVDDRVVFNLEEAKARLDNIIDQFISSKELASYDTQECVVLLGGDIIDGELIYPAQSFDTDGNVFDQVKEATVHIWSALHKLSQFFPAVKVYCVPGNHGRSSKLHHQMANWDNALYFGLQLIANAMSCGIEVHTPNQMWMDFSVRGWRVHMRHIGVVQATTGGGAKKVMTWMGNHDADLFFYGHYHCPEMYSIGHKRIFKNGALPPSNDFAENLGFMDGVGQWMIGVTDSDSVAFAKILIPD